MGVPEAIFRLLSTDPGVTALVAPQNINPTLTDEPQPFPSDVGNLPAIAFMQISETCEVLMDGPANIATERWQFDAVANTYDQARAVTEAIRAVLHGFKGIVNDADGALLSEILLADHEGQADHYDSEGKFSFTSSDFFIRHRE